MFYICVTLACGTPGQAGCLHSLVHHRFPLGPLSRSYGFTIVIFIIFSVPSVSQLHSCHDSEDCIAHGRAVRMGLGALKTKNASHWAWSSARVAKNTTSQLDRREEAMDFCMLWSERVHYSQKEYIKHVIHYVISIVNLHLQSQLLN